MKKRHYIFTNKKNSDRAIMSMILGIISNVSLGIVVYLAYKGGGEAPGGYGVTGFLAMVFSLTGLVLGIATVRDKQNFRLFPWLGTVLNLLALAFVAFLLYLGNTL